MIEKHSKRSKSLILIGGGHAHIQVLFLLSREDLKDIQVTLISDGKTSPYSGMLPGYLFKEWKEEDLFFDLAQICSRYGFRFLDDAVEQIMAEEKRVVTKTGLSLSFDYCSVNTGILPLPLHSGNLPIGVFYVKPISTFIEKWKTHCRNLRPGSKIVIVGGGGAGFELAIACAVSLASQQVTLVTGSRGLLPEQNSRARRMAYEALTEREVRTIEGETVLRLVHKKLIFQSGQELDFDLCLVSTSAAPPAILKVSLLPVDSKGFLCVDDFLQVQGHEDIFASGDCVHFSSRPLPKAGVYAVRQGPVLAENISKRLKGEGNLKKYIPQESYLSIFVSGKSEAILSWKKFAFRSPFAWQIKKWIDRRFMKKFR